jgi:hypothetical protein
MFENNVTTEKIGLTNKVAQFLQNDEVINVGKVRAW